MELAKQRTLVRASATVHKQKEGSSSSAPKSVIKGSSKRKSEGKDDHPLKKGSAIPAGDKSKKSLPSKPSHGASKGLMTAIGPISLGTVHRLLTHKEHAVEMVESIIKETDLDRCVEQTMEDLEASSLFDLSRVRPFFKLSFTVVHSLVDSLSCFWALMLMKVLQDRSVAQE